MNKIAGVLLFMLTVIHAQDDVLGLDRMQEFHGCTGSTAYIPWPITLLAQKMIITLSFQRRHSEKNIVIATFNSIGKRELNIINRPLGERLVIAGEDSGIFLKGITFDDAGLYTAQAKLSHDQVWTRTTNLTVHVRPIPHNGRLNITRSEIITNYNKRTHCVNLTCGTLEYAGYPPAKFVWSVPSGILEVKVATDYSSSSVQICSPFYGEVTCSIAGYSSLCTYDLISKLHLDLPGPPNNGTSTQEASMTRDLVLMIVMPILAVILPVTVLAIWVLRYLLRARPRYRDEHFKNRKADNEIDIEENLTTEQTQTHNNEDHSDLESETERKEEIRDSETDIDSGNENNNIDHILPVENDNESHNEEEEEEEEDDSDEESDDENRGNEERHLMEDSASPVN
ncbi:uncharacterized protein LOC131957756 isoform X2 [Physella acuta]|uniref:uncharacterized protein LOC131957756 isoform X2 n=1 Tax=Physella acuta TaxID=109671 RepID=UPI0027DCBF54|nr:uncharacterized protein LOC131957756 isoform X2 [Physella acuta]